MPLSLDPTQYKDAAYFIGIASSVTNSGEAFTHDFGSYGEAVKFAFRYNSFRKACLAEAERLEGELTAFVTPGEEYHFLESQASRFRRWYDDYLLIVRVRHLDKKDKGTVLEFYIEPRFERNEGLQNALAGRRVDADVAAIIPGTQAADAPYRVDMTKPLAGAPLADERPQAAGESESEPGETKPTYQEPQAIGFGKFSRPRSQEKGE